jgi:tetrahydromethanopterin S-methyltransferase subunit G
VISRKPKAEEIIMAEISKEDILEVLKEFSEKTLDPKFTKIDQRFEQIDQRMDGLDKKVDQFKDEIIQRFHVISEDVISQVKLVAEGVINLDEKFTREMSIFRKENEQAHEEIKAMIKFSYAELDRRISTLEIEVQELKRRMDQIERRSIS